MKFKITSKIFIAYLWFINLFTIASIAISGFITHSFGYELAVWSIIFMTIKFLLCISILCSLIISKGPIKILLYFFGFFQMYAGINGIINQYLIHTSAPSLAIISAYVATTLIFVFGLLVVIPIHRVVKLSENV